MHRGYIIIWRKIMESSFYTNPNACRLAIHCLLRANHKDQKIIFNREEVLVKRGTFITGLDSLQNETGLTFQNLRTSIKVLENVGFITRKVTNRFSVISVCKYGDYQNKDLYANKPPNNQVTIKQQSANNQLTTDKNVKNDKNVKKTPIVSLSVEKHPYLKDNDFTSLWTDWLVIRKEKKAANTERALSIALKKLHGYPINTAMTMLEKSIVSSWKDVFELNQQDTKKSREDRAIEAARRQ